MGERLFFFFIIVTLTGMNWYRTVVLICIYLMTNDGEQGSFHVLMGHSFIFFGELPVGIFYPFLEQRFLSVLFPAPRVWRSTQ